MTKLRVLPIFEYLYRQRGNDRIIVDFMKLMEPLCSSFNVMLLLDLRVKIEKGYTSVDLQRDYKPDVVILYGDLSKEVFGGYFTKMSCVKTVVVTDFHSHVVYDSPGIMEKYKENGFDIMFRRGISDLNYRSAIPMVWVPFCASEKEFYPDDSINRINLIGFAGMTSPLVYVTRRKAIKLLKKAKLLRVCPKGECSKKMVKKNKGYPAFLRSHVACLTSTDYYIGPPTPRAKTFEIMGSGTVLLTPYFWGMEELLGKDGEHYVKYDESCSDVVRKAREIVNNPARTKVIAANGHKVFLEKHTNSIRIKEFYAHLVRLVEGKPIERRYECEGVGTKVSEI